MFSHAAHTHARSHVVATYYTTILLKRAGLRSVAASRDACKGATIDWYSFRGRLYPRTFSRSFVTRRNRGGHRNVPSIRPTSDALHAPLSLPSFSILRAHVRLANTSAVFPFYTRWKNARAFSLFLSLSFSPFQQSEFTGNRHVSFPIFQTWIPPRSDLAASSSSSSSRWRVLPPLWEI